MEEGGTRRVKKKKNEKGAIGRIGGLAGPSFLEMQRFYWIYRPCSADNLGTLIGASLPKREPFKNDEFFMPVS